jgi:hypothetical protein
VTQSAVNFKDAVTGREKKTDGLWTHLGVLVVNRLIVTGTATLPTVLASTLSVEERLQRLEARLQQLEPPEQPT